MTSDVSAELLILRKRAGTWILLGIWTLLGVFFAYVVPYALDPGDRAMGAGWLILAVWGALGALLGVLTRGTSLAIGIGILYGLVIEGLLSAFSDSVSVLEPLTNVFLRANGYSLATALGASRDAISSNGPGSFGGPFVASRQAVAVLVAFPAAFTVLAGTLLRRRDITE